MSGLNHSAYAALKKLPDVFMTHCGTCKWVFSAGVRHQTGQTKASLRWAMLDLLRGWDVTL